MKNIVITGGTSGVGFSIARTLIGPEANIILVGKSKLKAQIASDKLNGHVSIIVGDLSTKKGVSEVVSKIIEHFKTIDVLVNSAGVAPFSEERNINVNLLSHLYLVNGLRNYMSQGSRILLVTGNPNAIQRFPIFERQKSKIEKAAWVLTHKTLLMIYLANELKSDGILVNSFFPGEVKSDLMPYTQALSNTSVSVGKFLALDTSIDNVTGKFFDERGSIIPLNSKKYSYQKAKDMIDMYVE